MGVGFVVLFVLMLVTAGWWFRSRWTSLRDSQAERREAEMMFVFEARSKLAPGEGDGAGGAASAADGASALRDFDKTLPG